MIVIENFGLNSREKQEEFFEAFLKDKAQYVSYYSNPIFQDIDDDTIDEIFEGLIHFYDPCIRDLVRSCVIYHIFLYCYNNNTVTPMNIMYDMKKYTALLENGKFKLMDRLLRDEIKKAVSLCLQLNVDYNEYEKLKCRAVEINRQAYFNGMLRDCENEVMWYGFTDVHELVSELHNYGRFEFLLTDHNIEDHLIGFETYENAESFDLKIYPKKGEADRQLIKNLSLI